MTATPISVANQLLDAMTAKDKGRTLALFADDAVLIDPHYPSPTMSGKDAIGAGLDFAFGLLKQPEWKILRDHDTQTGFHRGCERRQGRPLAVVCPLSAAFSLMGRVLLPLSTRGEGEMRSNYMLVERSNYGKGGNRFPFSYTSSSHEYPSCCFSQRATS
jgi:hypothetical protein